MSKEVTRGYSEAEMQELVQKVADEYDIETTDINADVKYQVGGSFALENAHPVMADLVEDVIRDSISDSTGVPPDDIDVSYNVDTGIVEYTVETDTYDASNSIKEHMNNDSFIDTVES